MLSFWGFLVLCSLSNPFLLSVFPNFKLCSLFNIDGSSFKKTTCVKKQIGQEGVCNKTLFITCVLQTVKSCLFLPIFGQIFVDVPKKDWKIGVSAHFEQEKSKNYHFERILSGPSKGYYLVQVWPFLHMANLDQLITPKFFARNLF